MTLNLKPVSLSAALGASALTVFLPFAAPGADLDLREAVVLCPSALEPTERKAVAMFEEEAQKRTGIQWEETAVWPTNRAVIAIGPASSIAQFAGPFAAEIPDEKMGAEGYRLFVRKGKGAPAVFVIGNDSRGVLFGIGRLLRELRMARGNVTLDDGIQIATVPRNSLRGHQLGYRPKCNSYDAWDLPVWEQYYRDLAVFGCNTIELIPPRSDDDADSPHFPRPPMEMMTGMSRLADQYGLDVWIWYPAMDADYSNPATVDSALREWQEVFRKLPRIDAVFVPGGDPGHTAPKYLLALLEKQTESLHRFHPKAQMWVSPQSFNREWFDQFIELLKTDPPSWLTGIVFGPQVRVSLSRLRELIPRQYPIRHYPDITHSRQCQYPVPDWDVAYALTEARECINPRPEDEAAIFRKMQPFTVGFVTYSEGCNDDVNKMLWSALGWDPEMPVAEILRQYGRYFISDPHADDFAQGLFALERDWRGSLATNQSVQATLARFQALEKSATPFELRNWRFQQALFRAYYDAYVQRRLEHENALEQQAMSALRGASSGGSARAIASAEGILDRARSERTAPELRARIMELGEALFQSIGMQLSVGKYKAVGIDRGASLDTLDYPLNNRPWLAEQFGRIGEMKSEPARLQALDKILRWTDAGPGGFYDDLGNPGRQPHLVRPFSFDEDPGSMESVRSDFEEDLVADEPDEKTEGARRVSWIDHAETLYDTPLEMRYTGLDPSAHYKIRVVYAGDNPKRKIRLVANDDLEVHPLIAKPIPFKPLEFPLPPAATRSGSLTLNWFGEPGLGGNGRGCQVSEVWLLKESTSASP
jgi:hypothetical protein